MPDDKQPLRLRLICLHPLPPEANGNAAEFGLQDKKAALLPGTPVENGALAYDFSVDVQRGGTVPNFIGPYTHGTPEVRFLYLSYRHVGSQEWIRRIKIPLGSITLAQVDAALREGRVLQAAVDGRRAGTVELVEPWTIR